MMKVVEANYGIAHEYFRLKAQAGRVCRADHLRPVRADRRRSPRRTPTGRAQRIDPRRVRRVLPAVRRDRPAVLRRRWIDAELRRGKRGGAFCASPSPQVHPYVLCNYTDNLRDAMTVAHELGHGIHGYLSLGPEAVNYHPTLPLAETASVFGEMLVFDHLVSRSRTRRRRLGLLCGKIEDTFATVFRQNVLTRFEQAAFEASAGGRLTHGAAAGGLDRGERAVLRRRGAR